MFIKYLELKKKIKFDTNDLIIALIAGHQWYFHSFAKKSVYFGYWLEIKDQIFKIIENINVNDDIKAIEIIDEKSLNLIFKDNKIFLYLDSQGLNFESLKPVFINIDLDIRKLYETALYEINYKLLANEKIYTLITNYNFDINIFYEGHLNYVNKFIEVFYDYDYQRKSIFLNNRLNRAFEGYITKLKIFSTYKNLDNFYNFQFKNPIRSFIFKRILSLLVNNNKLRAGLPWFPQRWFRDELISLLFLKKCQFFNNFRKKIINYYLENLDYFWQFNNDQNNHILSADTLLLTIINLEQELLTTNREKLIELIKRWEELFKINEDLLPPQSTWMDTLERKRALEIDFLYYLVLKKLGLLEKAKKFKLYIKNRIYHKNYFEDEFLRPNIFLCYFLDKNFFEKEEWEFFFNLLIENNYLSWGGFSSLNKNHPNFQNFYTGENPLSYHQGDSWFWLNNLGYYSLKDLNYLKYKNIINKMKKAIIKNLLAMGIPGYLSELSSANKITYEGSPVQLWSLTSLFYNL